MKLVAASHKVTVERLEFKRAVGWLRRGRTSRQDLTLISMEPDGFKIRTELAETAIKSVGLWTSPIVANAGALKRLADMLPRSKEVVLEFESGGLKVGPTRISAWTPVQTTPKKQDWSSRLSVDSDHSSAKRHQSKHPHAPGISALKDQLCYDEMLMLADVMEGWMLDETTTPDQAKLLDGVADDIRQLATELGHKWKPEVPQRLSLLGFLGKWASGKR